MTEKKVGIITLPLKNNYGGIIQLIALYHFLEKQRFCPVWVDKRQCYSPIKRLVIKLLEFNPFYKIYDPKEFARSRIFLKIIAPFLKTYLPERTSPIYNQKQLIKNTSDFHAIIAGSDQIWRLEYIKDNYPTYFLDFVPEEKKKIAYAASFGKDYWEGGKESIDRVKNLLNNFDLITVREDSGVNICNETFGIENVHHVLDPSFLPDVSFYEEMIKNQEFNEKTELFNYVLDPTEKSDELVKNIVQQQNLNVHKIYLKESNFTKNDSLIAKWLAHFYYADFVVTDSFHGMVFSIIFNKQFLVVGNQKRGLTRFSSLLKLLKLEDRLLLENENYNNLSDLFNNRINYETVNNVILESQRKSREYLIKNLY
jgi:hypothetical protein